MADLSKIKVGDKLRLEVTVTDLDQSDWRYPVSIDRGQWLDGETIEAAEHIPAPRVFKRGDWVRFPSGLRHGFVAHVDGAFDVVWVSWPDQAGNTVHNPICLEPDEAPE